MENNENKQENTSDEEKKPSEKSVHSGHRQRMRERFRKAGNFDSFADHEVLEMLLFLGRARGDVNPAAHKLLETFGSLSAVLEARPEQLVKVQGIGEESAAIISMMVPLFRRYSQSLCQQKKTLENGKAAREYCVSMLAGYRTEHLYVICLDQYCQVLGYRLVAEGSPTKVPAYPRIIAEAVLNYNAQKVILCHNHPAGNPTPSDDDIATTKYTEKMLFSMGITLLDHIIVAGSEAYSLVQHGDLIENKK